jgi:hypothetical protein
MRFNWLAGHISLWSYHQLLRGPFKRHRHLQSSCCGCVMLMVIVVAVLSVTGVLAWAWRLRARSVVLLRAQTACRAE